MRQTFEHELEELFQDILYMGGLVKKTIQKAVHSLKNHDLEGAQEVIENDDIIDDLELKIEEKCMSLIARQQPMAKDLRRIGTALKIITDLERIADHSSDIAKITLRIGEERHIKPLVDVPRMANIAQEMVNKALEAFIDEDVDLAYEVCNFDDEVDHLHNQIFRELLTYMLEDTRNIKQATHLLFVSSSLERIGDHATNLGEWLIYMVTGNRKELND